MILVNFFICVLGELDNWDFICNTNILGISAVLVLLDLNYMLQVTIVQMHILNMALKKYYKV